MKKAVIILSVLLVALVITGCGKQSANTNTATSNNNATASAGNAVTIKNFTFEPSTLTVKAGTTVTWTNQDSTSHQVASNPHPAHTDLPGLDSGTLSQGQTYSFTFTTKGTFGYHCHLHPSMQGTIVVN